MSYYVFIEIVCQLLIMLCSILFLVSQWRKLESVLAHGFDIVVTQDLSSVFPHLFGVLTRLYGIRINIGNVNLQTSLVGVPP